MSRRTNLGHLRVEPSRPTLAQMTRWKSNDPPSAAQPRDDSGFDQSLSVDSDIVAFTTERTNEPARRDPPGTPGSTQREPTLDHSDELDELLIPFINNPVDAGLGKRVPGALPPPESRERHRRGSSGGQ